LNNVEEVKSIKLYGDVTLEDIFKIVVTNALEERNEALSTFKEYKAMIDDDEGLFMNGDKPASYLEIAQKATDNITKLLGTIPKILDISSDDEKDESTKESDLMRILNERGVGPKRLIEMSNPSLVKKQEPPVASFFKSSDIVKMKIEEE